MTEAYATQKPPGPGVYTLVFLVLIGATLSSLLTAEVLLAQTDPARLPLRNSVIFAIASVKAVLIAMFYMHLRYEPRPVHLVAVIPLLIMAFLVATIVPFQTPAGIRLPPGLP